MSSSTRWTPSRYVRYGRKEDKYEWTQSPDEVTVTIQLPVKGLKAKDLDIVMKANHLKVAIKAKEADPIINGELQNAIDVDNSTWTKQDDTVELMLAKGAATKGDEPGQWWPCVIKGHKQIDVKHIEGSKYLDDSLLKKIWEKQQEEEAAGTSTETKPAEEPK